MTQLGKLIVFEGPDGVGKTTLAHKVVEGLNHFGFPCSYYAFPGRENGTLGWHVYNLHHNHTRFGIQNISQSSLQLLHIAAHIDAIENKILPMLRTGQSVVLDRYWWSTWVYGIVHGATPRLLQTMLQTEQAQWENTLPATVFLISRGEPFRSENPVDTWQRLCSTYAELAEEQKKIYPVEIIYNQGDCEDVVNQIIDLITRKDYDQALT